MIDLDACCDTCRFYNWYHSKCAKWGEMTDYRSVCDSYEPEEGDVNENSN